MTAIFLLALGTAACGHRQRTSGAVGAGLPIYPGSVVVGEESVAEGRAGTAYVAVYRSPDSFERVTRWYAATFGPSVQAAYDARRRQATFAIFATRDRRSAHVRADGRGTIIELARLVER